MPWFRIDDGFHCHPKILAAGNAAVGLYVRCGSYCSQQLTDGFVPETIAKTYGKRAEIRALLDVQLIQKVDGGYLIPDFLDFNPSAAKVQADRAEATERQRRHREKQAMSRRDSQRDKRVSHSDVTPTPSRPVPSHIHNGCTESSVSLTVVPNVTDDDPFAHAIALIVDAKQNAWTGRIANPRSWRNTVTRNTITEDGELIRRMLNDGTTPEATALFVLGHGLGAETEQQQAIAWCTADCETCNGEAWIPTDHGLAPCPQRTA